jgi:Flp pilus assembly protein TadD
VLRAGLGSRPPDAALLYSLGLALVRLGRSDEALVELERAAKAAPEVGRYAYVWGVALHSAGRIDEALMVLDRAHRAHPGDVEILSALVSIARDAGRADVALRHARKLLGLRPADPGLAALVGELEAAAQRQAG